MMDISVSCLSDSFFLCWYHGNNQCESNFLKADWRFIDWLWFKMLSKFPFIILLSCTPVCRKNGKKKNNKKRSANAKPNEKICDGRHSFWSPTVAIPTTILQFVQVFFLFQTWTWEFHIELLTIIRSIQEIAKRCLNSCAENIQTNLKSLNQWKCLFAEQCSDLKMQLKMQMLILWIRCRIKDRQV